MKRRNAGRRAVRARRKSELSGQHLRIVLRHTFHDPGLENGGIAEIGNIIVGLLARPGAILIADMGMGGIVMQRTRSAWNNGKLCIEVKPSGIVR
jgi:hypothetical protein